MSAETEPFSAPPMRSPRKNWPVAVLLFALGFLILFLVSLQYVWPDKWWRNAAVLNWKGDELRLVKGQGNGARGNLTINGLDKPVLALAPLTISAFRADDYPVVQWSILNSNAQLKFVWQTAENPGNIFTREFVWAGNSVMPLYMDGDANWRGQITELGLIAQAPLDAPLVIEAVRLEPFSPLKIVGGEWFGTNAWQGTSINFVGGRIVRQWFSPLPFVAAVLGLALLGYGFLAWRKILVPDIQMVCVLFFMAWFTLDMRWQFDLWQKLGFTQQSYAGKSWKEKHLAASDRYLFDFMQQVNAKLPSIPSRIFLFQHDEYMRNLGAYYLYPHNVLSLDLLYERAIDFKSGDFIIVMGEDEVEFDPKQHLLKWGAGHQVGAEILLRTEETNVLLKVL